MTPTIVTALFEGSGKVPPFSRVFSTVWVERLWRNLDRHSTVPWRMVLLVDKGYDLDLTAGELMRHPVYQVELHDKSGGWMCLNEAYRPDLPGVDRGVFMGLDTIFMGNVDDILSRSCFLSAPRNHAKHLRHECMNPVVLFSRAGGDYVWERWQENPRRWAESCVIIGRPSEMKFLAQVGPSHPEFEWLDDTFPGALASYKLDIQKGQNLGARIVYFHGRQKPHELEESNRYRLAWEGAGVPS